MVCEKNLKPNAVRDFKKMVLSFNAHEYNALEEVSKKTGRSKANTLRWAVLFLNKEKNIDDL